MGFLVALRFLTIIPLPWHREASAIEIGRSVIYFPLVGLFLGLILVGLDQLLGLVLPLFLVNALLIIAMVILTGALHLDGFIDTCDGVMVRSSAEERLSVMADSRVGSFGTIGACCLLLLEFAALSSITESGRVPALLLMPVLSRWAMVYAIFAFPYAKEVGTGQAFKQQANWQRFAIATAMTLLISLALCGLSSLALMAAIWLIVFGVAAFFKLRLAGLSGDTYGAINELAEVLVLILLPLLAKEITTPFTGPWQNFDFEAGVIFG